MTRIEEIKQAAEDYYNEVKYLSDLSAFPIAAFKAGVEWADKTMLDKVCRFVKELCRVCDITDENGYVVDYNRIEVELRKQMKGE